MFKLTDEDLSKLYGLTCPVPEDEEDRLREVRRARTANAELQKCNGSIRRVAEAAMASFDVSNTDCFASCACDICY